MNQLNNEALSPGTAKSALTGLTSEQIFDKYAPCFEGIGRISEPYHIKIDDSITPVVHPPRKLPATSQDRVQAELFDMESKGIIKAVNEPTAWVNSMVVNEKRSGRLRICIDPRDLNKAIRREHYQLPTQQEYLTTFNTPFGRYLFTVVPFGMVFAQEVFHKTVHEKFNDIPGCETDIDDILIWGRTIDEHDLRLEQVLNHVQEINMTLSQEKCQFRQTEVTYLGERLTQEGVKPDGAKLKAIRDYVKPTNKQDVQRLLGMVNFIAKFAPKVSDVTAPPTRINQEKCCISLARHT